MGSLARSRAQNIAFYAVAIPWSIVLVAFFGFFGLTELVLYWFPDSVIVSVIPDIELSDLIHRIHWLALSLIYTALTVGVVVQLRHPERRLAPLLMALAFPIVSGATQLAAGITSAGPLIHLVPLLIIAALHPRARDLLRRPRFDAVMGALALVAAIPWVVFAIGQERLQMLSASGEPHAEQEHWQLMAAFAILIALWAFIGATAHSGWRLTAWVVALSSAIFGLYSLIHPGFASAATGAWAIAAIGWAIAYAAAAERRVRSREGPEVSRYSAEGLGGG